MSTSLVMKGNNDENDLKDAIFESILSTFLEFSGLCASARVYMSPALLDVLLVMKGNKEDSDKEDDFVDIVSSILLKDGDSADLCKFVSIFSRSNVLLFSAFDISTRVSLEFPNTKGFTAASMVVSFMM